MLRYEENMDVRIQLTGYFKNISYLNSYEFGLRGSRVYCMLKTACEHHVSRISKLPAVLTFDN